MENRFCLVNYESNEKEETENNQTSIETSEQAFEEDILDKEETEELNSFYQQLKKRKLEKDKTNCLEECKFQPKNKKIKPYISKRELELLNSTSSSKEQENEETHTNLLNIPKNLELLKKELDLNSKESISYSQLPNQIFCRYYGHKKPVNTIKWSPGFGHLLSSASMDHTVKLWDIFKSKHSCVLTLNHHLEAVKDIEWSLDGTKILSGGFDKCIILTDVETGKWIQKYQHNEFITSLSFHPNQSNVFLAGAFRNGIIGFDLNSQSIIREFKNEFGQVHSLVFINEGKDFISSADILKKNSIDKGILVWNFDSGIPYPYQIYLETFSCTCLKTHPNKNSFVAQSSGDYIAIFSLKEPFSLNKKKRFQGGHRVGAHSIKMNFNSNGEILASGSSDGCAAFYNWKTGQVLKRLECHPQSSCYDVTFHPCLPSVVATCGWDSQVTLLKDSKFIIK